MFVEEFVAESTVEAFAAELNQSSIQQADSMRALTEFTLGAENLTWEKQLCILQSIDEVTAEQSLDVIRRFILDLRRLVHRADTKTKKSSSNPLSFFGNYERTLRDGFWKRTPQRITPAQMLGGWLATMIIARKVFDRSDLAKVLAVLEADSRIAPKITDQD